MTPAEAATLTSTDVRDRLVEAVRLDLVGPGAGHTYADECLPGWVKPSTWYLTGFLIPSGTPPDGRGDADEDDEFALVSEDAGVAEESTEERKAARKGYFPSSMGLSFLVPAATASLDVVICWGDYEPGEIRDSEDKAIPVWQRTPCDARVAVALAGSADPSVYSVPGSGGLQLNVVERPIAAPEIAEHIPPGTRSVSVFLVNHRAPDADRPDRAYAFQAGIEVRSREPFVPRPDLRATLAGDWDEQVADLHYADAPEFATGHGASAEWDIAGGECRVLRTAWIPDANVEKTTSVDPPGVELSMDALGTLADGDAVTAALSPLVARYREWIARLRAPARQARDARRPTNSCARPASPRTASSAALRRSPPTRTRSTPSASPNARWPARSAPA